MEVVGLIASIAGIISFIISCIELYKRIRSKFKKIPEIISRIIRELKAAQLLMRRASQVMQQSFAYEAILDVNSALTACERHVRKLSLTAERVEDHRAQHKTFPEHTVPELEKQREELAEGVLKLSSDLRLLECRGTGLATTKKSEPVHRQHWPRSTENRLSSLNPFWPSVADRMSSFSSVPWQEQRYPISGGWPDTGGEPYGFPQPVAVAQTPDGISGLNSPLSQAIANYPTSVTRTPSLSGPLMAGGISGPNSPLSQAIANYPTSFDRMPSLFETSTASGISCLNSPLSQAIANYPTSVTRTPSLSGPSMAGGIYGPNSPLSQAIANYPTSVTRTPSLSGTSIASGISGPNSPLSQAIANYPTSVTRTPALFGSSNAGGISGLNSLPIADSPPSTRLLSLFKPSNTSEISDLNSLSITDYSPSARLPSLFKLPKTSGISGLNSPLSLGMAQDNPGVKKISLPSFLPRPSGPGDGKYDLSNILMTKDALGGPRPGKTPLSLSLAGITMARGTPDPDVSIFNKKSWE